MKNNELRPQDILALLMKITPHGKEMSGRQLAAAIGTSSSGITETFKRCRTSQLIDGKKDRVNVLALEELLVHGIRYVFPAEIGRIVRGIPTYISASPIKEQVVTGKDVYVWPCSTGTTRGQKISPLYPSVPQAVLNNEDLYRLLVIVDTLRLGRVREREIAIAELHKYIESYGKDEH